jgi:hypothetical protein
MSPGELRAIYEWYYQPGEQIFSYGFYKNPCQRFGDAQFRHIFGVDGEYNLYIGQYSVYAKHIEEIFKTQDIRERGMIFLPDKMGGLRYSNQAYNLLKDFQSKNPIVYFEQVESKNFEYLNRRMRKISQRLYDYGLPQKTVIVTKNLDLMFPTLETITQGRLISRPDKTQLLTQLENSAER